MKHPKDFMPGDYAKLEKSDSSPLADRVWASYRAGQEIRKNPSKEYLKAVQEAIAAIKVENSAND